MGLVEKEEKGLRVVEEEGKEEEGDERVKSEGAIKKGEIFSGRPSLRRDEEEEIKGNRRRSCSLPQQQG